MRILLALVLVLAACGGSDGVEIDGHVDCDTPRTELLPEGAPELGGPSARAAVVEAVPGLAELEQTEHWYGRVTGVSDGREVLAATAQPEQDGRWYIVEYEACPGF